MSRVDNIINQYKSIAVIGYVAYHKLDKAFNSNTFSISAVKGKLGVNALELQKSLYDLVCLTTWAEKNFVESLGHEDDVVVYIMLPNSFYIILRGKYNPDRVVAVREGSVKHVYFVAESKDNDLQNSQLRGSEESKIECANLHFKAISDNCYIYDVAKDYKSLYDIVNN